MSNHVVMCRVLFMPSTTKIAYTLSEAAEAVGLSEKTLERAIQAGELKASRPTRRWSITVKDLTDWITSDRRSA